MHVLGLALADLMFVATTHQGTLETTLRLFYNENEVQEIIQLTTTNPPLAPRDMTEPWSQFLPNLTPRQVAIVWEQGIEYNSMDWYPAIASCTNFHELCDRLLSLHEHINLELPDYATMQPLWNSVYSRIDVVIGTEPSQWKEILEKHWITVAITATDGQQTQHNVELWINPGVPDLDSGLFGLINDGKGTWTILRGDKAGSGGTAIQTTHYGERTWSPIVEEEQMTKQCPRVCTPTSPEHCYYPVISQLGQLSFLWSELALYHWPNDTTSTDRKVDLELVDFPLTTHRRSIPTDLSDADALQEAQEIRNFGFHSIFHANGTRTIHNKVVE